MKAKYSPRPSIEFELEEKTQKDLFKSIAECAEIFGEGECGNCHSKEIFPNVRNTTATQGKNKGKTFTYYAMVCKSCGHFLPFGQHNNAEGTLFPDRKVDDGSGSGDKVFDKKHKGWRPPMSFKDNEEE